MLTGMAKKKRMGRPPNKERSVLVRARIPETTYKRLVEISDGAHRGVTGTIRAALEEYVLRDAVDFWAGQADMKRMGEAKKALDAFINPMRTK
jgi:hypothetical protein